MLQFFSLLKFAINVGILRMKYIASEMYYKMIDVCCQALKNWFKIFKPQWKVKPLRDSWR